MSASTQNKKILIVDDPHPAFAQATEKLGYTCTIDASFTREKTLTIIAGYEGLNEPFPFLFQ